MAIEAIQNLIYLSSRRSLPEHFKGLVGVRWHFANDIPTVTAQLQKLSGVIFCVVHTDLVNDRTINAFLSLTRINPCLSFIFIAKNFEKSTHQLSLGHPQILTLFESDGGRICEAVTRRLRGVPVKSRKRERLTISTPVILQNSMVMNPASSQWIGSVGEGQMLDFSRGGAQIIIKSGLLLAKDYFRLGYRDLKGDWVTVEAQARWSYLEENGDQRVGVQFIALSA